jgi:hypothetical protein
MPAECGQTDKADALGQGAHIERLVRTSCRAHAGGSLLGEPHAGVEPATD